MEQFIENVFGSQFFQLPFLEALSYIAAVLLIGAVTCAQDEQVLCAFVSC